MMGQGELFVVIERHARVIRGGAAGGVGDLFC